jgi:hypothetical protein
MNESNSLLILLSEKLTQEKCDFWFIENKTIWFRKKNQKNNLEKLVFNE